MKIMSANRIAPDGTPHFVASHLRLLCLPMSHKKDARLNGLKKRNLCKDKVLVQSEPKSKPQNQNTKFCSVI